MPMGQPNGGCAIGWHHTTKPHCQWANMDAGSGGLCHANPITNVTLCYRATANAPVGALALATALHGSEYATISTHLPLIGAYVVNAYKWFEVASPQG